jgi:hypothetical protein
LGAEEKLICIDVQTGDRQLLTEASYGSWSPDERLIAAVRSDRELILVDRQGGTAHAVLSYHENQHADELTWASLVWPEWSTDGQWLAFCLLKKRERSLGFVEGNAFSCEDRRRMLEIEEQSTFVLDVAERSVMKMPWFSDTFKWRPGELHFRGR